MTDQPTRSRKPRNPEHERTEGAHTVFVRNLAVALIHRRMGLAALMSLVSAAVSLAVLLLVIGKPVPPQYIPITQDGRLLPLIPLNKPNVDDGAVGQFALEAVRDLNNYDYLSWQTQVLRGQPHFTPVAWKEYIAQFEATNIVRTVEARKMIVIGRPSGNLEIQNRGLSPEGVFTWRIAVPLSLQYIAHAETTGTARSMALTSEGVATLYIQRVPTTLSANGLAVRAYQYEQKTSP